MPKLSLAFINRLSVRLGSKYSKNLDHSLRYFYLSAFFCSFGITGRASAAAWWFEQAERLQNVSATLLDGPPISEPVPTKGFIAGRLATSLLPKPSSKVGDKEEKVPAAPVHAVPTLVTGGPLIASGRYTLVATAWAGYLPLPQSIAKTMGVNAALNQYQFGGSMENVFRLSKIFLTTSAGVQYSRASLTGAITAEDTEDSFTSSATLVHVSQGIRSRTMPLWANGMILMRRVKSKFKVKEEQTEFVRTDTMADARLPVAFQMTIGATFNKNLHLALSEYVVPDRLVMPRVSLVYQVLLGAPEKQSSSFENPPAGTDMPRRRFKKKRK
jgi:hypothetical protein